MQATKGIFFRPQSCVMYPRERQEHDKALGVPDAQQTGSA